MTYNWNKDLKWIQKHLMSGKIISRKLKNGLLIPFEGATVSTKPPAWFQYWSDNVFIPFKDKIEADISELKDRVSNLETKVDLIMKCPTIKKEISNMKTEK